MIHLILVYPEPFIVFLWLVSAAIGLFLGLSTDRGTRGAVLGALLGPIGWVVIVMSPGANRGRSQLQRQHQRLGTEVEAGLG